MILDWPGWSLSGNKFGKEFDGEARKRMVEGCLELHSVIQKYHEELGLAILEIGPFFNPLIIPHQFKDKEIFYLDNDAHVNKYLTEKYEHIHFLFHDLNMNEDHLWANIEEDIKQNLKKKNINRFNSIILSQVLNYIDYKTFFQLIKKYHEKNGLIFINNVIDYGIPQLFSDKRPRGNNELIDYLKKTGYSIIEQKMILSKNKEVQNNSRLILVGQN